MLFKSWKSIILSIYYCYSLQSDGLNFTPSLRRLKVIKQVSAPYWSIWWNVDEGLRNYCFLPSTQFKFLCAIVLFYANVVQSRTPGQPITISLLNILHCELQLSVSTLGTFTWSLGCLNTWPSVVIAWCLSTTGSDHCLRALGSRQCWFRWTVWLTLQGPSVLQEILSLCH